MGYGMTETSSGIFLMHRNDPMDIKLKVKLHTADHIEVRWFKINKIGIKYYCKLN